MSSYGQEEIKPIQTDGATLPVHQPQLFNVPQPPAAVYYYPFNQQLPPPPFPQDAEYLRKNGGFFNPNIVQLDYSKDYCYSVVFIVLGFFFYIPFLFNLVYIRSPNTKARNIAFSSLIVASAFFLGGILCGSIFAWDAYLDSTY